MEIIKSMINSNEFQNFKVGSKVIMALNTYSGLQASIANFFS